VRLYDPKQMKFVKVAEERKILRQIQTGVGHPQQTKVHAVIFSL